jgi:nitrogen regulatory protein PII
MKRIEAFIRPFTVDAVKSALYDAGVQTIRITEVKELTRSNTYAEVYRGVEYEVDVVPRVATLVYVEDQDVDRIVAVITEAARTESREDDGVITIASVDVVTAINDAEIAD